MPWCGTKHEHSPCRKHPACCTQNTTTSDKQVCQTPGKHPGLVVGKRTHLRGFSTPGKQGQDVLTPGKQGLLVGKRTYLRDNWNCLDFFIVCTGMSDLVRNPPTLKPKP